MILTVPRPWGGTLLLSLPDPPPLPTEDEVLILPIYQRPLLPYAVDGIPLPTQPTTMTAPLDTLEILPAGTRFYLAFNSPDSTTLHLLPDQATVLLQFGFQDRRSISALVKLQSTLTGSFLEVWCTLLQNTLLPT